MAAPVEREKEWETLTELLGSADRGRGRVAVVSGPVAGGKTTLLERFTEHALSEGALVLEAAGSRAERWLPFGILRRILDSAAPLDPVVHAEATALLDAVSTPCLPGAEGPTRPAAVHPDPGHPATGYGAGHPGVPYPRGAVAHGDTAAGVEAGMQVLPHVCASLLRIARDRTVVIAVDDVHHGDELSRAFLLCLARRVRQAGVLIVLTEAVRLLPAQLAFHAELQRQPNCTSIRLPLLSADGTGRILAERLSTAAAQRLAADCQDTTGGNPLLVKALLADGVTALGDSEPFQPLAPAETFERAVLDCLHRGDPETVPVARGIAVLGDACAPTLLSRVSGTHAKTVELAVQDLNRCGMLRDGAFRHTATRDAVLAATPPGELSALHRRAAGLLHQEGAAALDVARHLLAARTPAEDWAIPVLQDAAEYALVDDDPELALRCGELAVDSCPDGPRRTALKSRLVSIVWRSSPVAAESHLRQLSREFCAGRLTDRDLLHAVTCLAWMGEARQAAEAVHGLQAAAREAREAEVPFAYAAGTLAAAQSWLSVVSPPVAAVFADPGHPDPLHGAAPHPPAGTSAPGTAAAPYDMPDDAHVPAGQALRTAMCGGQGEAAVVEATRVLQRYHLSDRTLTPLVLAVLALVYAGRIDLALAWTDRLLGECATRSAPTWQAVLGAVRAEAALRQGDLPGAAAQARRAMSLISVPCWGVGIALPLAVLIEAETRMGNLDEAMGLLEQPVPETMLETHIGLHYLRARGRAHLATGRHHAALRDFLTCGELMQAWGMDGVELAPWRLDAAEAWLALGNVPRAREYVEQQRLREAGPAGSRPRGSLLYALARTSGDLAYRLKRLTEAVEILEQGDDRLQLARTLGELGSAYRAAGDFNRARMLVRKAWHVAKSCGAQPLCQEFTPGQGDGEPAAVAGREAESPREAEVLSEAEARVALLAARGHTNREIATKLYVTVSTVEQHLTRIYRKLQVKRRRDLPARLWDLSLPGIA
ncbi:LuxR family transcriptional regulator [Streptomyces sp. NRRL S-87]|uniref:helix-turn-helix transcriptional regulator n=1 Tax=Streptomyces sp. NRRL S-87 TaxID=1463920 RepID=UPI00055D4017|nr:LuxR family transcriptional regulator [Streptomyces sp. NRRL S-87]